MAARAAPLGHGDGGVGEGRAAEEGEVHPGDAVARRRRAPGPPAGPRRARPCGAGRSRPRGSGPRSPSAAPRRGRWRSRARRRGGRRRGGACGGVAPNESRPSSPRGCRSRSRSPGSRRAIREDEPGRRADRHPLGTVEPGDPPGEGEQGPWMRSEMITGQEQPVTWGRTWPGRRRTSRRPPPPGWGRCIHADKALLQRNVRPARLRGGRSLGARDSGGRGSRGGRFSVSEKVPRQNGRSGETRTYGPVCQSQFGHVGKSLPALDSTGERSQVCRRTICRGRTPLSTLEWTEKRRASGSGPTWPAHPETPKYDLLVCESCHREERLPMSTSRKMSVLRSNSGSQTRCIPFDQRPSLGCHGCRRPGLCQPPFGESHP